MLESNICLTLDQLRGLVTGPQSVGVEAPRKVADQRYVLVRGDRSGVFCGVLTAEEGRTIEMTQCRHIWYWAGAANVADISLNGVARPAECKIVAPVARLRVLDAVEVVDCTAAAEASLRAVPNWTKK